MPAPGNRWRWFAFLVAVWTAFALLSAAQSIARVPAGQAVPFAELFADRFADWYSCALFTPAYFWLANRYPVTGPRWGQGVLAHLAATQLFVVLKYTLYVSAGVWLGYRTLDGSLSAAIWRVVRGNIVYENMAFWAVAAVVHAYLFHRSAQER